MSSNISKFVKAAEHIHHTELGTMVCIDFFKKMLSKCYLCFIRLGGQKRYVESEKWAMEQKRLRSTAQYCTSKPTNDIK